LCVRIVCLLTALEDLALLEDGPAEIKEEEI
jgi:hypothetical protein